MGVNEARSLQRVGRVPKGRHWQAVFPTQQGGAEIQLDKTLLAHEIDLQAERKSPSTIRWYRHKPHYFAPWLSQERGVSDIEGLSAEHIKAFFVYVQGLRRIVTSAPRSGRARHRR
jgi:hypothetical protein